MKVLILSLVVLVSCQSTVNETTTFILVRHSEKANDGTKNPSLSEIGEIRSQKLAELVEKVDITAIYSTDYTRTKMTVEPLASKKNLEIQVYSWDDHENLASELLRENNGGVVLVSGHSNTTPFLANALLGKEHFQQFDDSDYTNLLFINVTKPGEGKLLHLSF